MTNSNRDFLQCSRVLNYSNDAVTSLCAAESKSCRTKHDNTPLLHRRPLILSTAFAALVYAGDGMQQVRAESVSATGDLNSLPPGGAQHWNVGGDLVVGDTNVGTLLIDAGGTVSNDWGYVGNTGTGNGTITVQGTDGSGNASTWTSSGQIYIGVEAGSNGALNILNGGVVTNSGAATIGNDSGSTGIVIVSGAGSTWGNPFTQSFQIGAGGSGTLQINNGGTVHSGQGVIGYAGGSAGTLPLQVLVRSGIPLTTSMWVSEVLAI